MKHKIKRIVLFRFHDKFGICKNKLEVIRHYNPDIEIYGLYGGETKNLDKAKKILGKHLVNIYTVPVTDTAWKWQNGDLSLCDWFRKFGHSISFDVLHLIEWDLLELGSFDEIYKHIPADGVGLTGLVLMKKIPKWYWITKEPWKSQWLELLSHVKEKYDYDQSPHGCLGPGNVFPRAFIEKYSAVTVPVLCHEEIRFPLYAQVFGFKLYDNGFFRDWYNHGDDAFFCCEKRKDEIKRSTMDSEMRKTFGRRVFHPCTVLYKRIVPKILTIAFPLLSRKSKRLPLKTSKHLAVQPII